MQANIYWSSYGLGDAVMQSAMISQTRNPALPTVVFVRPDPPPGMEFYQCIKWIDYVVPWPTTHEQGFPYQAIRDAMGLYHLPDPLQLNRWDFRDCELPVHLPERFVAVQPSTHLHATRVFPETQMLLPVVLLGTEVDRRLVPWENVALDLRGKLTIAQSVEVVRRATETYGCDSWVATLGCMLGKPSTMRCTPNVMHNLVPGWRRAWQPMTFIPG